MSLTFEQYLEAASKTAIYPTKMPSMHSTGFVGMMYLGLKLNGESGEVAEEIGKSLRDDGGLISEKRRDKLIKELGDVLWYWSMLCMELGVVPSVVAGMNLQKLQDRQAKGTIQGSGSDR